MDSRQSTTGPLRCPVETIPRKIGTLLGAGDGVVVRQQSHRCGQRREIALRPRPDIRHLSHKPPVLCPRCLGEALMLTSCGKMSKGPRG